MWVFAKQSHISMYVFKITLINQVLSNFNPSTFKRHFLSMPPNIITTNVFTYIVLCMYARQSITTLSLVVANEFCYVYYNVRDHTGCLISAPGYITSSAWACIYIHLQLLHSVTEMTHEMYVCYTKASNLDAKSEAK